MNFLGLPWVIERVNKACDRNLFIQIAPDLFFGVHTVAVVIQLHKYLLNWVHSASFWVVARVITFFSEIYMGSNCNVQQIC